MLMFKGRIQSKYTIYQFEDCYIRYNKIYMFECFCSGNYYKTKLKMFRETEAMCFKMC